MTDQTQEEREDNTADVAATVALLTIVVGTVVYWLAGMPS
ncbi:methionine synthase [Spongiibacter sp. KMU-158]|uniref:Methionine synthase n=1 Tax=Spongiibacter pelagi TaxID=2760804 RepID=A0A927C0E8_9GAMM|nr:methionine synthase [Spongiibacter pelagi]MBD2858959.1 methionine synthase [Spongiibacter pelagi]